MTRALEMSLDAFLKASEKPRAFPELVVECIQNKGGLSVVFKQDRAVVDLIDAKDVGAGLTLQGHWSAEEFSALPNLKTSARLYLPFLFETSRMVIPEQQIAALDMDHRPVVDFFVRNLFMAIGRDCPITCTADAATTLPNMSRTFQRHYMYLFKHIFPEKSLGELGASEVMDFILVNSFFPMLDFENTLLRQGADQLRKLSTPAQTLAPVADLKGDLLQTRSDLMKHF